MTTQPAHQQNEGLAPKPYSQSPRQYFDDQPALKAKLAASAIDDDQIGKGPASLPITGASFEPSVPLEGKEAIWLVVSAQLGCMPVRLSLPLLRTFIRSAQN